METCVKNMVKLSELNLAMYESGMNLNIRIKFSEISFSLQWTIFYFSV